MIPSKTSEVVTQGNLHGRKVDMSVDLSNLAHIMNVLTDLYSDPVASIAREYSTNALDSHAMAGQVRPIEIDTPTVLRHTLEIQDFGIGMSADEVAETYGTYGASTKRETNDATGCLGLGSKSALTYTTSFNVRAVKDGKGVFVVVYRDDNGAGSMNILDEFDTDEPNGVRVIIPVDDPKAFTRAVENFVYYATPGSILVNGEHPRTYLDDIHEGNAFWANDRVLILKAGNIYNTKHHIVMGNVAYPCDDEVDERGSSCSSIYFADMGNIDFTPSREALNLTPKTKGVIESYNKMLGRNLIQHLHAELQQISRDQIGKFLNEKGWCATWNHTWVWNGIRLADRYKGSKIRVFRGTTLGLDKVDVIHPSDKQFFLDMKGKPLTPKRKAQIDKYIKDNSYEDYQWVLMPRPDYPVFDVAKDIDLDDIDKIEVGKIERVKRPVETPKYQWYFGDKYCNRWSPAEIPTGYKDLVWTYHPVGQQMAKNHPTVCFVTVPSARRDKFLRLYPNAISQKSWSERQEKGLPVFEEKELKYLSIEGSYQHDWLHNYKDQILDPEIKEVFDVDKTKVKEKVKAWNRLDKFPAHSASWLEKRYPLVSRAHRQESIRYINMAFKESNV